MLAIRGAIAIGLQGGVRPADDSWLTEFWEVGHTARNATEAIHEAIPPFQGMVGDTTVHLQDHVNALEQAAHAIDAVYPARLEEQPASADNHG
ncbi:hypothetical protein [Cupriavidus sp. BIC8F]|uniref:hypothetical protein n=1 Tax=Cupriavidus sp. BIC8F TaxID=3079014 RepID=UPI0029170BF1|nr:hypothetical protein [Cupriavidus sp. BIC8F]